MDEWNVESYQDERGRFPAEDYLAALPPKERARVTRVILLLEDYGPTLKMPHARHLQDKIWELRIDGRPNGYRALYAGVPGRRFLLLHIFAKKTDETPAREIATAQRRLSHYLEDNL